MSIVCGVDFSESSREVASVAAGFARRLGRPLVLVHVLERAVQALSRAQQEEVREALLRRLDGLAAELGETLQIDRVVLAGAARPSLLQAAAQRNAELLVLGEGERPREPFFRPPPGPERTARATAIPLLVVRRGRRLLSWARGEQPLRVLLAVDRGQGCETAVAWVRRLAQAGPLSLVVGHVYYAPEERLRYGLRSPLSWHDAKGELERLLQRDLARRVGTLEGVAELRLRPYPGVGRAGDHLLELAEEERIDLVVLGTQRHWGPLRLGSAFDVLLRHGGMSLARIPPAAEPSPLDVELPTVQRVLVPTDFSQESMRALPQAYGLLARAGGEVELVHVVTDGGRVQGAPEDVELTAKLRALVPQDAAAAGIVTRTHVVHHPEPARALVELGERLGADVLCLASHGRSGLSRLVVGSVTDEVLRRSSRPVLVVRPPVP